METLPAASLPSLLNKVDSQGYMQLSATHQGYMQLSCSDLMLIWKVAKHSCDACMHINCPPAKPTDDNVAQYLYSAGAAALRVEVTYML